MPNTINGLLKPKFTMINSAGQTLRGSYDIFPYCGAGGLQPRYAKDFQVTELESGRLEQDVFGYRNKYTLDYSQKLDASYCLALMEYLNNEIDGGRTLFEPTTDGGIVEEVIFTNAEFLVQLMASAGKFVSMQGIVIELTAVELKYIDWRASIEAGDPLPTGVLDDFGS